MQAATLPPLLAGEARVSAPEAAAAIDLRVRRMLS
jgi:hypothetical protein